MPAVSSTHPVVRRAIRIECAVHGVGFSPAIVRLARSLDLGGVIRDEGRAVSIEVEGAPSAVGRFLDELGRHAPSSARVDSIEHMAVPPRGARSFEVDARPAPPNEAWSDAPPTGAPQTDLAPCDDCVRADEEPAPTPRGSTH